MATAIAQGKTFTFPEGTTPEQMGIAIDEFFAGQAAPVQPTVAIPSPARAGVGALETATAIGTGIVAEPIAGLSGIAAAVIPGGKTGAEAVEATREALTFRPRTPTGQRMLGGVGKALEPVAKGLQAVEDVLGDSVLNVTGSPALAAAAATAPTAVLEGLGLGVAKKAARVPKTPQQIPKISTVNAKQVENALIESAPNIDQLKDASRAVYKELDDLGVVFKKSETRRLKNALLDTARKRKFKPTLTPKTSAVLDEVVKDLSGQTPLKVSDIEDMRRFISDRAGKSLDLTDSSAALELIDDIDLFLDRSNAKSFFGKADKDLSDLSGRYKVARSLWGRARRSEMISEAFVRAERGASGFENGIRVQLRQILNNRKKSRFFTKDELAAMDDVVKGTNQQNVLKLVGRLGFSEGQATNILGGLGGLALGGTVGGPAGAATISTIGQFSRRLAQRATLREARLADAIVRAGNNGKEVAKAYLRLTPKPQRSAFDLSELLLNVDTTDIIRSANKLTKEAAEIAKGRRALGAAQTAAVAAPIIPEQVQQ